MSAIIYRNILYFKHNITELVMQIINSFIQICPIYFMVYVNHNNKQNYYIIVSYLIACFILDIAMGVCFEYYKEIISNKNVDLVLAGVGKMKYAFSQGIVYLVINSWIIILVAILVFKLNPFEFQIEFSFTNIFLLILSNILFVCSLCIVSAGLAILIDKTKLFSIGALVCNFMLLFSGCYTPINKFPAVIHFLFYINPFYYYTSIIQSILLNGNWKNDNFLLILGDICVTLFLFLISKLLIDKC